MQRILYLLTESGARTTRVPTSEAEDPHENEGDPLCLMPTMALRWLGWNALPRELVIRRESKTITRCGGVFINCLRHKITRCVNRPRVYRVIFAFNQHHHLPLFPPYTFHMALQPSLRPFIVAGRYDAPHTLEIFCECGVFRSIDVSDSFQWTMCVLSGIHTPSFHDRI